MLRTSVVIGAVLVAASVQPSAAQPGAAPVAPASTARVETRWYGWQVLAVDVASVAVMSFGSGDGADSVGIGGLVFGGPAVHLLHGHGGRAVGSLVLRVGAPLLGGLLLSSTCDESERDEFLGCLGAAPAGALVGAAVAVGVDLVRSNDVVEVAPAVAPTVMVTDGGAQLGVIGRF